MEYLWMGKDGRKTEPRGQKRVTVALCPPKIPLGPVWD